ncbi:glycosyltransferase [Nakamurella leprariae]|uniref:4,4'-diaponeurosporenoate glycosyltransferase n=1 Tax=Nakamurella leprariae TaxID=2803911 RepID=A0A938YHQ9_9ACTN|nr:glycosyltransferase [Nakamurella leprariae]MBM9468048.1 glycosyltransferase [Nakamurella leprariae]
MTTVGPPRDPRPGGRAEPPVAATIAIPIGMVAVVIPARDEEVALPGCLAAVDRARRAVAATRPGLAVRIVVVADRCSDGTDQVALARPHVELVRTEVGRVGAARAAGAAHVLTTAAATGVPPERVWLISTDADSWVPADWLEVHLQQAETGAELVLGAVTLGGPSRPDPGGPPGSTGVLSRRAHQLWQQRHRLVDGHEHVFGANLGIRGDTYLEAGGFADVAVHEDVLLARAVAATGARVAAVAAAPVHTSTRLDGRTDGGMAAYLRGLAGRDGTPRPADDRGNAAAATGGAVAADARPDGVGEPVADGRTQDREPA